MQFVWKHLLYLSLASILLLAGQSCKKNDTSLSSHHQQPDSLRWTGAMGSYAGILVTDDQNPPPSGHSHSETTDTMLVSLGPEDSTIMINTTHEFYLTSLSGDTARFTDGNFTGVSIDFRAYRIHYAYYESGASHTWQTTFDGQRLQ